jgi:hypothetical protein
MALVLKYLDMRACSDGIYLLVKLVTFWASSLTRFVKVYCPALRDKAEYSVFSVAMIDFSSSVICLLIILLIFVILAALIFLTVSLYRSVSTVNESTHAKTDILGGLVAVRMSLQV